MRKQYCTFHLDQLFLGVEVRHVQEVLRFQRMTRVPLASAVVEGLINLRGQIVTAIDLRRRLELPERAAEHLPMNVVVRDSDGIVSLLVDEIGDVLEVEQDEIQPPPSTLRGVARDLIAGVFKLKGRLLLLLDIEQMFRIDGTATSSDPIATNGDGAAPAR
jgi:purine-binding chemotaxis protein CheW